MISFLTKYYIRVISLELFRCKIFEYLRIFGVFRIYSTRVEFTREICRKGRHEHRIVLDSLCRRWTRMSLKGQKSAIN